MAKLFGGAVTTLNTQIAKNTTFLSNDLATNLAQGELGKSISSIDGVISSLSDNVCCITMNPKAGTSVTSMPSGKIVLNTRLKDTYSLYDQETGLFTSPVSSLISFTVSISAENPTSGGSMSIYLIKNANQAVSDLTSVLNDPLFSSLIFSNSQSTALCYITSTYYVNATKGDTFMLYSQGSGFNVRYNNAQITMKW